MEFVHTKQEPQRQRKHTIKTENTYPMRGSQVQTTNATKTNKMKETEDIPLRSLFSFFPTLMWI